MNFSCLVATLAIFSIFTISPSNAEPKDVLDFAKLRVKDKAVSNLDSERSIYVHQPNPNIDPVNNPYGLRKIVSRFELWGNPSRFEGMTVSSCGYLSRSRGCEGELEFCVYPSKSSLNQYLADSIRVKLNPIFQQSEKFKNGEFVEFVGVFRKCGSSSLRAPLGELSNASLIILGQ